MNTNWDQKPKISIITVVLNSKNPLENTIKSVAAQTYANIEYIVIDGASTDGTVDVIKKYEKFITKWISEPDNGIFYAMNKGLNLATGDYVWFINAGDEIYEPETLEKVINSKKDADFYYGEVIRIGGKNTNQQNIIESPRKITSWRNAYKCKSGDLCHQAVIIKKNLVENYDVNYIAASDADWVIKAFKKSTIIYRFNDIMAKFLIGGFSSKHVILAQKEFLKITLKHHSYKTFFASLFQFLILNPADKCIGLFGIFLKNNFPKIYYWTRQHLLKN